ncbi:MAG TPA: hypothetical protein VGH90_09310 [Chthoniobacteraceae bacterium]
MKTVPCRDCKGDVSPDALACPICGARKPAIADWNGEGYEFVSQRQCGGRPLVHVAFGMDRTGKARVARGIVAIGQRAVGLVAIGILAGGGLAIGVVAAGGLAIGVVSVAAIVAVGANSLAPVAFGVVAAGYYAGGLHAIGWKILFSFSRQVI